MKKTNGALGLSLVISGFLTLGLTGCKSGSSANGQGGKADVEIQKSFTIQSLASDSSRPAPAIPNLGNPADSGSISLDKAHVSVSKSALEKEFLLQIEVIGQYPIPQFNSFQSRIVMFREKAGKLYLIESSRGQDVGRSFQQDLLLAEYPIISETDQSVTFDFNLGMKNLFIAGDWVARDQQQTNPFESMQVGVSYIDSAEFSKNNNLVIKQIAQMNIQKPSGSFDTSTSSFLYYLAPYIPNPVFKPTVSTRNYDRMGFFEVAPTFNDLSGTTVYATKEDISKPIVYAISANTPADYKQAVKDGILYWNKAFGKEMVQAIDAPAGVTAPDADYNIVQWVEWDSAGMAYADAQMDPLTGEILHQQVYFTSAWAKIGYFSAEKLRRLVSGQIPDSQSQGAPTLGLQGFISQKLCNMDMSEALSPAAINAILSEKDPAKVLKASQDLMREVVAHEVGHTLGLRHNFAGSTAENILLASRMDIFKKYLGSGAAPAGIIPTSTVMDYNFYPEGMMVGDMIAKAPSALDYDTKAIKHLFLGNEYKNSEIPLFCTDSQVGKFLDCVPYDAGSSYIEYIKYNAHEMIDELPRTLLEAMIASRNPLYGNQATPLEEMNLDAKAQAATVLAGEANFMNLYGKDTLLLQIARAFPTVNSSNQIQVRTKTSNYVLSEITKNGGLENIFLNADNTLAGKLIQRFSDLLSNSENLHGLAPDGKQFSFSDDDVVTMKALATEYFNSLQTELIKLEVQILAGTISPASGKAPSAVGKFENSALSDNLAPFLAKRLETYVLESNATPTTFQKVSRTSSDWAGPGATLAPKVAPEKRDVVAFNLPNFNYEFEVRKTAASFLKSPRAENLLWAFSERMTVQKDYVDMLNKVAPKGSGFSADMKTEQLADFPKPMAEWLVEALAVGALLQ